MDTIRILGNPLYQWEIGRKVQLFPLPRMNIEEVHFSNFGDAEALVVKPKEENGAIVADIPNILLQSGKSLVVYSVYVAEGFTDTLRSCTFNVRNRAKPSDYVYTETEVLNYGMLEKRIKKMEEDGVSEEQLAKAVEAYLSKNPVGVPSGGKAGQYLRKKSDVDRDVEWADLEIPKEYGLISYNQDRTMTIT